MLFLRTFHVFLLTAAPLTVMKRMKNEEPGRYDLCLLQFVVTLSKQKKNSSMCMAGAHAGKAAAGQLMNDVNLH